MSKKVHEILMFPNVGDRLAIAANEEEKILYRCKFRVGDEEGEWNDAAVEDGIEFQLTSRKSHFFDLYIIFIDCEDVSSTEVRIDLIRDDEVVENRVLTEDELSCEIDKVHLVTIDAIVG